MKEKFKSANGITLIALIITIIILLILAVVSINLVLNEGIIKRAENAVNAYDVAQTNELQQLNELENQLGSTGVNEQKEPWYNLTEEEKTQLVNAGAAEISDEGAMYGIEYIGQNNFTYRIMIWVVPDNNVVKIDLQKLEVDPGHTDEYNELMGLTYIPNDTYVTMYQEEINKINPSLQIKVNTWYHSQRLSWFGAEGTVEYTGNINDWIPQDGSICQSYINRLIQNFNK